MTKTTDDRTLKDTIKYLIITFLITYLFWGADIIMSFLNMYEHPSYNIGIVFYMIAAAAPSVSVYILMQKDPDKKGMRSFLRYLLSINKPPIDLLVVVIFTAIRFVIPFMFGEVTVKGSIIQVIIFIPVMIFFGGLEEPGWRGYLQPVLDKRFGAVMATLINCAIWCVWHLPLCFIKGTYQYSGSYLWFMFTLLGTSFCLVAINKVSKSVLPCILFHATGNSIVSYGISVKDGKGTVVSVIIQIILSMIVFIICSRKEKNNEKI